MFQIGTIPRAHLSTTGTLADTIPPTVSLTAPVANVNIPINTNIVLTFSEAVNVGSPFVNVVCPNGTFIAYTRTPAALPTNNITVLTLDPNYDLPLGITCEVSMAADKVMDIAGNHLINPGIFTFNTVDFSLPNQAPMLNRFSTGTPTLSWSPLSWVVSYEVEIDTDKDFAPPGPTGYSAPLPSATTSLTLPTALPNGAYYFHCARHIGGQGRNLQHLAFTIVSG